MAVYDFGLTEEQLGEIIPGQFRELAKRRNIGIKYDRYANAITASAVYNVNRLSDDAPIVTAFDFVRDEKDAIKLERIREAKRYVKQAIGQMPMTTPRSKFLEVRSKAITDLIASGHEGAEALFDSVWPHLKPKENEEK